MVYPKKTEPHPSELPKLSDPEILALEVSLRKQVDSWAWLQLEQEKEEAKKVERSSWFKRREPRVKR